MKNLLMLPFFLGAIAAFAQAPGEEISASQLDTLLAHEIMNFRAANQLPEMETNSVLTSCSYHHSRYMSRSRIVSHYQEMKIRKSRRLYAPEDRIKYYSGDISLDENTYSEICLGLKIDNDSPREIAGQIFSEIMNSDNKIVLSHPETRYFGLSVMERKGAYYVTINVGMGYNNAVALLN